jgi:hypothetical protein
MLLLQPVHESKWKEVTLMKKLIVVSGLVASMLFAGATLAADQTRTRSKEQTRTTYQKGIQDHTRTRDQQKSQTKDQTRTRDRAKDGFGRKSSK